MQESRPEQRTDPPFQPAMHHPSKEAVLTCWQSVCAGHFLRLVCQIPEATYRRVGVIVCRAAASKTLGLAPMHVQIVRLIGYGKAREGSGKRTGGCHVTLGRWDFPFESVMSTP